VAGKYHDVRGCGVNASVVVVGNELLTGHTEDANGPFLARQLRSMGHRVRRITVVPDEVEQIVDVLEDARSRGRLIFVCGGLGPTGDDVTADAVAAFLGRKLHEPEAARDQVRRIYRKGKERGLLETAEVDDSAWRMARVPEGGTVVRNDEGVAPGSVHETDDGARVCVLPGPPAELQSVFGHVRRRELLPTEDAIHETEVHLATYEAPVSDTLDALETDHPHVEVGSYPQHDEKRVVVRLRGGQADVQAARKDLVARVPELVIDDG
jgi:molybdenum cofactor synthesis domain-containing protein